jgi:hypothetical protein
MYKANSDGTVVGGVFDKSVTLPEGWVDHPEKARKPVSTKTDAKRGPGRPPKAKSE